MIGVHVEHNANDRSTCEKAMQMIEVHVKHNANSRRTCGTHYK